MTVLLLEIKLSQGIGLGSYQHRHISAPVRPNQDIDVQRHIPWFYMAGGEWWLFVLFILVTLIV